MSRVIARLLVAALLAWLPAAVGGSARAAEEILSYDVTVVVGADGVFDVTERIRVNAEGNQIRRGIFRDFPVIYRLPGGYVHRVGFTVTDIARDGRPEPWHAETIDRFRRIYIGDADVYIPDGVHDYVLRYRTTRQLRHFGDRDEVYWNATGNFWSFPILSASARIELPPGARILSKDAYTGPFGATGRDWRIASETPASITFETTEPLSPNEGLTVAVGFTRGIVPAPGAAGEYLRFVWDNLGFFALVIAAVATALYFWRTWVKIGRDPDRGTIIPLFSPPARMSPGVVSYVYHQGFPSIRSGAPRAFIAALMNMAVQGVVKIIDNDGDVEVQSLRSGAPAGLSTGEAIIASRLFKGGRGSVPFTKSYGPTLQSAVSSFKAAIDKEFSGVFFRNNYGPFAVGAGLSLAAVAAFFVLQWPTADQAGLLIGTLIGSALGTWLIASGGRRLLGRVPGASTLARIFGIVLLLAGLVVLVLVLSTFLFPERTLPLPAHLAAVILGVMNVSFFYLLRAPTLKGREVMDQIEGFRLYLTVAEEGRLNLNQAPEMSQQLFERFLPYAIALGVEKPWTKAFQKWLAIAHPEADGSSYRPAWYSGRSFDSARLDRATAGMVAGISAGMAAAMPSQSSSGSSGGGSSGGGGGGGGGGGW